MCLVSYLKLTNHCLLYKYNIFVHLDVNYQVSTPTVVWCLCIEMHAKQDAIMSDKMHFDKYHAFFVSFMNYSYLDVTLESPLISANCSLKQVIKGTRSILSGGKAHILWFARPLLPNCYPGICQEIFYAERY